MQQFIEQANELGRQRQPFFFLIDFEQQKPLLCPLEQAKQHNLYFSLPNLSNVDWQVATPAEPARLSMQPMDFADYLRGFEIVQKGLQHGDSYLLNLTYPTEIQTNYNFRQLFQQANAPYKLLLENQFVCFSPEPFVQIRDNQIFTYPMKGTINADQENAEQKLLNDEKELREHYTIVDLMRNDLGVVAQQIEVVRFRYLERIQTERGEILQTSSEICGQLAQNWQTQVGSMLAKLLPAGSISGAPKESTVQIIRQAELQPRGYYTGIFGVFTGDNLQSAVAIRYIEQRQDRYFFRSGGGITIQSDAHAEYSELLQKVYLPLG